MENEKQTTVAKKPKSLNKIISIILIILISFFSVGTLILSVAPKNFDMGFSAPDNITICTSNKESMNNGSTWKKDDQVYNKIMQLYLDSFKTTMLNSMFKGVMLSGVSIEEKTNSSSLSNINEDYIEFKYSQEQTLKLNGLEYQPNNSAISKKYTSIIITVSNTNSISPVVAYVRDGSNNYSRVRFNSYAIQSQLYDYITNL